MFLVLFEPLFGSRELYPEHSVNRMEADVVNLTG